PAAEHLVFLETAEETTIWAEETISSPEHEEWRVSPREEAPVSTDTGMTAPLESTEDRAPQPPRGQEVAASSEGAVSISEPEHVTESANVNAAPATSEPKPVARPVMGGGLPPTPSSSGSRPMFSRPPLTPPASSMAIPRSAGPVMPPLPAMPPARPPFAGRPSSGTGPLAVRQPNAAGPVAVPPSVPRQQAPTPASSQTPVQSRSSTTPRTPINPFLANDPNAKARRLSRALISDLVTYFPQRRDEGLRNGTLKDLFRDEIKKSFEEYVDQVGRDFANSTTHFQDALNDILAAGKKLF
ncbi:MAG TPA: hypothetical protein VLJ39_22480, partial [Tepidisphaeraceae bacterium]|nr:hypothetical protein [Tepidisphaeraceae bacterium]